MDYLIDFFWYLIRTPNQAARPDRRAASSWGALWRTSLRETRLLLLVGIAFALIVATVQRERIALPGITVTNLPRITLPEIAWSKIPWPAVDWPSALAPKIELPRTDADADADADAGAGGGHGDAGTLQRGRIETSPTGTQFTICGHGLRMNCMVDGDTFWLGRTKIRIADIDTPETHPPRCAYEARAGTAATVKMQALLNAGPFTLVPIKRDVDRYGRKLRMVERNGESLGEVLVRHGLARRYGGGKRSPWCATGAG